MSYTIEEKEGVLLSTLNRPERRNAINDELMEGFKEVIHYVHTHDTVRFLVITGSVKKLFVQGEI